MSHLHHVNNYRAPAGVNVEHRVLSLRPSTGDYNRGDGHHRHGLRAEEPDNRDSVLQ